MSAIHNGGCVKTQFIRRWTFKLKFEHLKRLKRGGLSLLVRCQIKVHNCKCSYLCCNIILLFSEILLLIEFCFIISLILLIFSPWPKYTSLGVRLSTIHEICSHYSISPTHQWPFLIQRDRNDDLVLSHSSLIDDIVLSFLASADGMVCHGYA